MLLKPWRAEDHGCRAHPKLEALEFGDGVCSKVGYRVEFAGSFAGRAVIYGFSVVKGACPPLFSGPGCTQDGAVIDEHPQGVHSETRVTLRNIGQERGHFSMSVDDVDAIVICLPSSFQTLNGADIVPVNV